MRRHKYFKSKNTKAEGPQGRPAKCPQMDSRGFASPARMVCRIPCIHACLHVCYACALHTCRAGRRGSDTTWGLAAWRPHTPLPSCVNAKGTEGCEPHTGHENPGQVPASTAAAHIQEDSDCFVRLHCNLDLAIRHVAYTHGDALRLKIQRSGHSLGVQWLGLGAFTAWPRVQSLVRELRSRKPPRGTKKKEKKSKQEPIACADP